MLRIIMYKICLSMLGSTGCGRDLAQSQVRQVSQEHPQTRRRVSRGTPIGGHRCSRSGRGLHRAVPDGHGKVQRATNHIRAQQSDEQGGVYG